MSKRRKMSVPLCSFACSSYDSRYIFIILVIMIWQIIGITGMALVLLAFILNQTHVWENDDISYDLCNFVGSGFLVMNAIVIGAVPFIILNTIWGLMSLRDVILDIHALQTPHKRNYHYKSHRKTK